MYTQIFFPCAHSDSALIIAKVNKVMARNIFTYCLQLSENL